MKYFITKTVFTLAFIVGLLLIGSTYYHYSPFYQTITKATAIIYPTKKNNTSGIVTFVQQKNGLLIIARISGLTPGKHGFHIHELGNCACGDAVCAGGHFDPTHKPHGSPDTSDRHVGDLGNITADAQGNATYNSIDKQATLNGPHSIIGRTVIVHAQEDDFITQPTGNAGARVGCGVIGIAKK